MTTMWVINVVGFRKVVYPDWDSSHKPASKSDVLLTDLPTQSAAVS